MQASLRGGISDHVLATDLDGTLIPLPNHPQNVRDLVRLAELLRERPVTLAYVTGRHLASVQAAIQEFALPIPDWILCDVGTTVYHVDDQQQPQEIAKYREHLEAKIAAFPLAGLRELFRDLDGLRLQETEKQGRFKLSYYAESDHLDELIEELERRLARQQAPFSLIDSIDPVTGEGLLDFLPQGVSKAHALDWWAEFAGYAKPAVVYAGDSGNDLAALTAGFRAILVANADRKVVRQVSAAHQLRGWNNRLCLASAPATSGVLEGCYRFGMFSSPEDSSAEDAR